MNDPTICEAKLHEIAALCRNRLDMSYYKYGAARDNFGAGSWSEREPEDAQLLCFLREKDRVKECSDNETGFWWLRSPQATDSSSFILVGGNGYNYYDSASNSYGVAFGFCLI